MASENNHLIFISMRKPFQCDSQPVIIILYKTVVKNQRHLVMPFLNQAGGSEAEGQVHLVNGAAADLGNRHQLGARIQKQSSGQIPARSQTYHRTRHRPRSILTIPSL